MDASIWVWLLREMWGFVACLFKPQGHPGLSSASACNRGIWNAQRSGSYADSEENQGAVQSEAMRKQPPTIRHLDQIEKGALITMPRYLDVGDTEQSRLKQQVVHLIGEGHNRLILDYSQTLYWGETSGGLEIRILKTVRSRGGDMVMIGMRPEILDVLSLLGYDRLFTLRKDERQAIDYLNGIA